VPLAFRQWRYIIPSVVKIALRYLPGDNIGEAVIQNIRTTRPKYNLISNNCQTYVLQLLDAIQVSKDKEFGTTLAVYERLFGAGKVADLFIDADGNSQVLGQPGIPPPTTTQPVGQPGVQIPVMGQELGVVGGTVGQEHVPFHRPEAVLHQNHANPSDGTQTSVTFAQQVMDANTTQLNTEEQAQRHIDGNEPKRGGWGEKISSFSRKFKK
jgi:hypothetical protein